MTTRDWTKERWRKQYTREPLEEHLWPVMARGLRELLNALAEDDGCLIRDADDPRDALVRALGAQPAELELVRVAVDVLITSGHLEEDERGVWIPELPVAQVHYRADGVARPAADASERDPAARTSTERVREFRKRQRERAGGETASSVSVEQSSPVSSGVSAVVSATVSESEQERNIQINLPSPLAKTLARSPVSSPVSRNAPVRVSQLLFGEEDDETLLKLPVSERASRVLDAPALAERLHPERWPELIAVGAAFAESTGQTKAFLGRFADDEGVRALVRLFASGFSQQSLEYVARVVPKQEWWTANGKRLGLSSLTLEVVRRNAPDAEGRARVMSPRVAKVIAAMQSEEKAHGAA
jgi:hypothetical protein